MHLVVIVAPHCAELLSADDLALTEGERVSDGEAAAKERIEDADEE